MGNANEPQVQQQQEAGDTAHSSLAAVPAVGNDTDGAGAQAGAQAPDLTPEQTRAGTQPSPVAVSDGAHVPVSRSSDDAATLTTTDAAGHTGTSALVPTTDAAMTAHGDSDDMSDGSEDSDASSSDDSDSDVAADADVASGEEEEADEPAAAVAAAAPKTKHELDARTPCCVPHCVVTHPGAYLTAPLPTPLVFVPQPAAVRVEAVGASVAHKANDGGTVVDTARFTLSDEPVGSILHVVHEPAAAGGSRRRGGGGRRRQDNRHDGGAG